jgi:thymidylate kinase
MIKLQLDTITIEGPDLAGKTTLYNDLHHQSGYKWNIQDRAELSMLCYSILYERGDDDVWRERLHNTINNLNNRTIVLLPAWRVIEKRYQMRGDEIQDLESLRRLWTIFSNEAEKIKGFSTVYVAEINEDTSSNTISNGVTEWLRDVEGYNEFDVVNDIMMNVSSTPGKECSPLKFRLSYKNPHQDSTILAHEAEEAYYANILSGVLSNISNELAGKNEYNKLQMPAASRRFIFTQDSCISLIHTMFRSDVLNVHVVCRSSDVVNTFLYDLRFLYYLTGRILRRLKLPDLCNTQCHLHVTLNSAHIIEE